MEYTCTYILVEEYSMKVLLEGLLPRILPDGHTLDFNVFILLHEGKPDLLNSVKSKAAGLTQHGNRMMVLVDQDQDDCQQLKRSVLSDIEELGDLKNGLVRIVCRTLEAFYLGQPKAIEKVCRMRKRLKLNKNRQSFDEVEYPVEKLRSVIGNFNKVDLARDLAPHLDITQNTSPSFRHLVTGIQKFLLQ